MKKLLWIGLGLAVLGLSDAKAQVGPNPAARERVELAKKVYRERIGDALERLVAPLDSPVDPSGERKNPLLNEEMVEELHKWSVRWMEAEIDASAGPAGRVTAAQSHLDRMMAVESGNMASKELPDHELVKGSEKNGNFSGRDALRVEHPYQARRYFDVAHYFRLEAEARVAREKAIR